jgi:hypothetical protein
MLQMTFGIDERDVRLVLEKHWDVAINPHHRSLDQLALSAWHSMGEEDRDRFATAAMEAYLDGLDEHEGGRNELRKYLIEHRFLNVAPRRRAVQDIDMLHARTRQPERRHTVRHR